MRGNWLTAASFAAIAVLALGRPAIADPIGDDPALNVTMNLNNTCPANCGMFVLGTDPISGVNTVEVELNGTIPSVMAGDLLIDQFGTSTVVDLLRFEEIGSQADIFIFSENATHHYDADVGLPPSYQSLTHTITDVSKGVSPVYDPTAGQPGYCSVCTGPPHASNPVGYGLTDTTVPEPMTLSVFGAGLAGLAALRRRKKVKRV